MYACLRTRLDDGALRLDASLLRIEVGDVRLDQRTVLLDDQLGALDADVGGRTCPAPARRRHEPPASMIPAFAASPFTCDSYASNGPSAAGCARHLHVGRSRLDLVPDDLGLDLNTLHAGPWRSPPRWSLNLCGVHCAPSVDDLRHFRFDLGLGTPRSSRLGLDQRLSNTDASIWYPLIRALKSATCCVVDVELPPPIWNLAASNMRCAGSGRC